MQSPADEERNGLPGGEDDDGWGEDPADLELSETASALEKLLSSTNAEVAQKRESAQARDDKFIRKHGWVPEEAAERLKADMEDAERQQQKWMAKFVVIDPAVLKAAIDNDPEIKELRSWMAMPAKERKARGARGVLKTTEPKLLAKLQELQNEIIPIEQKLIELYKNLRHTEHRLKEMHFYAREIVAPSKKQLQAKVQYRATQIQNQLMRKKWADDAREIHKLHRQKATRGNTYEPNKK